MTPGEVIEQMPPRRLVSRASRWFARTLLVAIAYYAAGRLGLLLAIPPGYASAFWPAAGIALAAVLIWGNRVWPGISLASFLANAWTPLDAGSLVPATKPVVIAIGIA